MIYFKCLFNIWLILIYHLFRKTSTKLKKRRCDNERHTKNSKRIFFVSRIRLIDVIQIIWHVINKFKSYEIIKIDERIATARRRRAIKKNILKIRNRDAWTRISENFKKVQQQKIKVSIKVMNKNTSQCQSIERIKKIQEKFNEIRINVQWTSFFNLIYIMKMRFQKWRDLITMIKTKID